MFLYRSRKIHWMNLPAIWFQSLTVRGKTGKESKVQVSSRCCATQCLERHATFVKIRFYCDYIHLIKETFSHSLFLFTASRISKTVNPDINTLVSAVTFGKGENIVLSSFWVIPVAQLSYGITVPSNLMNQSQVSPCNQWLVRDHVHARKV